MAEIRQGYLDDYSQQNGNVGIGTSISNEKLEIIGGTTTQQLDVTGISTFAYLSGFIKKHTDYTGNVSIDAGDSGTLSGEIIVGSGLTMTVGTAATASQGSVDSLKVYDMFQPPSGGTSQRPPAKPGALFYNFDYKTIEFFDGNSWRQVDNISTSGRGLWGGGTTPTYQTLIDFVTISSLGNSQEFGSLITDPRGFSRAVASNVRGVYGGGEDGTGGRFDQIEYFTVQSGGTAIDFGDLSAQRGMMGSASSSTRGIFSGGEESPGNVNTIEFIEIMTIGNAVDFGDISAAKKDPHNGLVNSPTRGVFAGGTPEPNNIIEMITMASTGNAVKFGDLSQGRKGFAGFGNSVRGAFAAGEAHGSPGTVTTMDYITITSEGNAIDFGDARSSRYVVNGGVSNSTRGVWSGGATALELIEYVNFATLGNSLDFGNLMVPRRGAFGCSDSHGGLGGF